MSVSLSEDARSVDCFSQIVLTAFSESGLQLALNEFAAACIIAGIKISTSKTEVFLSRNPIQYFVPIGGVSLKGVKKFYILWFHSRVMEGKTKNWMFDQVKQVL